MGRSENKETWRIGTLNVHSLMNKTSGVITHLEDKKCDICLIQETYLKTTDTAKLQEIRDYGWNIYSSPRAERAGGGIGVLYRDGVKVRLSPVRNFRSFQIQEVLIGDGADLTRLCNVYRPPYTGKARFTEANFLDEFADYLSELLSKTGLPLIMGDFNFQWQDERNFYTKKLVELLDSLEFSQLVPRQPTHNRGGTLDLVVCPKEVEEKVNSLEIYPEGTESDHFLVLSELFLETEHGNIQDRNRVNTYRDFRSVDPVLFAKAVRGLNLEERMLSDSPEENFEIFERELEDLVDTTVPLRRRKKAKKLRPWRDNEEVRQALRLRRSAERAWEGNKTPITKKQYNAMKKMFGKVDKEARINYVKADLEESKGDSNGLQRKLNRLLGKSEVVLPETGCDRQLAEDFADFFTGKVEKIRNSVTTEGHAYEDVEPLEDFARTCTFEEFREVSCEEIERIVKDMADKTCDLDLIPTWMIKECIGVFAPLFTRVINSSLRKAVVPETFQQAIVFPTIKNPNGDRDSLSNYRPVSNLPFISKVLEKVVLDQLNEFLQENNLLNPHQSGYRVGHSCETLLMGMFDDLLQEMDKGNVVALLLLDMSAAFDTVDHSKLVDVLRRRFGVRGTALQWFISYLGSRNFRVNVRGELSRMICLICGVPQGSLLGPVLFLLYVEELQDLVRAYGLKIKLYADDSQIYVSLVPLDEERWRGTKRNVEECLAHLKAWMVQHWLKCNESKTELLILGKSSAIDKLTFEPSVRFGDVDVGPIDFKGTSGKTLGIYMDENLTLERQVNSVRKHCGMLLKNLWQVNRCLDFSTKILLVKQLVISRLDYCNILYGGLPKKLTDRLQKVLNSCVRFIFGLHGHQEDYLPYLRETHILPIEQRVIFKACLMAYKIIHGSAPEYLCEQIPADKGPDVPVVLTRKTAVPDLYKLQYPKLSSVNARSKLRKRRPSVLLPDLWNALPLDLRSLTTVESFKTRLKTRLFEESFGNIESLS